MSEQPKKFEPQIFGRYYLSKPLAKGGMAEIFRAKTFGQSGFEKTLVVKRILAQNSTDKDFITMLSDEARLSVQLNHPNIVQVFDFGKIGEQYFLAMELVEGVDFNDLLVKYREAGRKFPIDAACYIVAQIARALDYAHTKKNAQGQPLKIIHRDVSPHNILMSFDGAVKLADFGIAKAESNMTLTRTGVIKGKLQYFSPEQVAGKAIDGKSDLYALGLVLFEAIGGRRLFDGDSQIEILGKVLATKVNADMIPEFVPDELKHILVKCLAYDVSDRYANASEFQQALEKFLHQNYPGYSTPQLSELLRSSFKLKVSQLERELDPPLSDELKVKMVMASNPEFLIEAEKRDELIETTKPFDVNPKDVSQAIVVSGRRVFWPVLGVSLFLFFFVDFLKPVASLAPLIFLLTCALAGFYYLGSLKRYLKTNSLPRVLVSGTGEKFILLALAAIIWGVVSLVSLITPENGVFASTMDPIAKLQESILNVGKDIREIKSTTNEIASDVKDIKEAISNLGTPGAAIADPQTPQDFYHNARFYDLGGEHAKAKQAYRKFIELAPDFLDGHTAYQALLNNTDGVEKSKAEYMNLMGQFPQNPSVATANAKLYDGVEKISRLEAVAQAYPDYAPVFFEWINTTLSKGLSLLTVNEMQSVDQQIKTFEKLDAQGKFKKYFADKSALDAVYAEYKTSKENFEKWASVKLNAPLNFNVQKYQGITTVTVMPQEVGIQKIMYRLMGEPEFKDTGATPMLDPMTGKPMPNMSVVFGDLPEGLVKFEFKYLDRNGAELGPVIFEYNNNPLSAKPFAVPVAGTNQKNVFLNISFNQRNIQAVQIRLDAETALRNYDSIAPLQLGEGEHTVYMVGIKPDGSRTQEYSQTFTVN